MTKEEKIQRLRAILGDETPSERLEQVLEASNGSIEHAIEIFFHQQQEQHQEEPTRPNQQQLIPSLSSDNNISETTRLSPVAFVSKSSISGRRERTNRTKRNPPKVSSPGRGQTSPSKKQARLDSFLSVRDTIVTLPSKDSKFTAVEHKQEASALSLTNDEDDDSVQEVDPHPKLSAPKSIANTDTPKAKSSPLSTFNAIPANTAQENDRTEIFATVSFERFAEMLQQLTDTTKRTIKLSVLETFIGEIIDMEAVDLSTRAATLTSALELVLGGITSRPLNVSGSAVSKALQTSLGVSRSQLSNAYRQYGDLGDCAASFFQKKTYFVTTSTLQLLSILRVSNGMEKICLSDGRDAKQHIVLDLLRRCQSKTEIRFLVRLLISNMRVGANLKSVLAALAMAIISKNNSPSLKGMTVDKTELNVKDAIALVQKTHDICPSIEKIVSALLEGEFEQMQRDCSIQVHIPIAPMLAHPIHALDEVEKAIESNADGAVMEFKYDGMRLQAHYDGTSIKLFSRHMLETTNQFPEVSSYLLKAFHNESEGVESTTVSSFIIDAEVVGVEKEGESVRLLPFQDLATRRKKNDDGKGIRVKVFAFDLMFLNGESLISESLSVRRDRLMKSFRETDDFAFVESTMLPRYDEGLITEFLKHSVQCGAEGLMVKCFDKLSIYEAGTRSHSWLKVKRDYVGGFADTIEVVPIGAWYGNGRKAQKSFLSPVLLAVYDDQEDVFRSISRCMSFTDAMYEEMRNFYLRGISYTKEASSETEPIDEEQHHNANDDSDADSSEHEGEEIGSGGDGGDAAEDIIEGRVNCFPARPSSTLVVTNESPSIWFKPLEVFEVSFADLSLSKQHTAAAGLVDEEGRGVALRFPRFKRRRPDKKPEQATTSIQIAQLFSRQSKVKHHNKSKQL